MCQCDTDAPARNHCMREKVFIWDRMGQDILDVGDLQTSVMPPTPGHKIQQLTTKHAK